MRRRRLSTAMQHLLFRLEQLSLQTRLFVAYILILLVPSLLISFYIFNQLNANYMKDVVKKNENELEIEHVNINNNIETMERAAQLSISDKEVLYYLERSSEPNASELIEFDTTAVSNILRLQFNNPNIEHIRLYTNNERINELWPVILREERIDTESWYKAVNDLNGLELWHFDRLDREPIRPIAPDDKESRPKIALLREIEYPAGRHVGIMEVDMLMTNFFQSAYRGTNEGQSQMFIIDREGKLFRNTTNSFAQEAGLTDAIIHSELKKHVQQQQKNFLFEVNHVPFLGVFVHIDKIDAYVLNVVSLQNVFQDINKTRNKIIIAYIILLIILSISTYFLNSLILKKLLVLAESMKKVRQGDFNIDLKIRGGGEVGELAHHFRKMLKKINELIAEAVTKKAVSKETELRTLKNQIDSHFLYNTLENIKMLAEIENQRVISDTLTSLGGMMRYNLKWTSEYVRMRDELSHITNYISIMNVRFDNKISLKLDIAPGDLDQELLKMSLQPIVENSIKHGMKFSPSKGRNMELSIRAVVVDDTMIVEISDNGIGMSGEKTAELNRKISREEPELTISDWKSQRPENQDEGSGIGLRNVNQRLQLFYGREYGLSVESAEGEYTRVVMRIPYFIWSGGVSG
ncbi:sensor histidine kinase [Paenibacillus solisilvae]|uniref:histidine kinase n=1 Tax=Paenibacillus solisilvae TaxID=2486751 RepID=A0ABW0VXE3_9BACL